MGRIGKIYDLNDIIGVFIIAILISKLSGIWNSFKETILIFHTSILIRRFDHVVVIKITCLILSKTEQDF